MLLAEEETADDDGCGDDCTAIFWLKLAFVVVCFLEGFISGTVPIWSKTCRTSPKILGIANSFAAGVFLAIALVHVLPEEIEGWADWCGTEEVFPLPEVLCFVGYTLILVLDKVAFDSHAYFDEHGIDPAEAKLERTARESMSKVRDLPENATAEEIRES